MSSSSSDLEDGGGWNQAKLKELILDRISEVHSSGSFATSSSFDTYVLPGISVHGVGDIQIPLSFHDAQALIQSSRKAPFGKSDQTLIDETVRKTWEIDGSRISFSNNAWHSWLQGIVRTVIRDLGVQGGAENVKAELYKMLLYEKGAMFKPHRE